MKDKKYLDDVGTQALIDELKSRLEEKQNIMTSDEIDKKAAETMAKMLVNSPINFSQLKSVVDEMNEKYGEEVAMFWAETSLGLLPELNIVCLTQEEYDALDDNKSLKSTKLLTRNQN